MKTLSIMLSLAALLLTAPHVRAAECTDSDLNVYAKLSGDTDAQQACAALLKVGGATTVDAATLLTLNPCDDKLCLAYFEKFANELSACTVQGFPLRQPFDALLAVCKRIPGGPPPPPSTTTKMPQTETTVTPSTGANSSVTTAPPATTTNTSATSAPIQTPVPVVASGAPTHMAAAVIVLVGSTLAGLVVL